MRPRPAAARALLGSPGPLDALDEAVVSSIRRRSGDEIGVIHDAAVWRSGWGIDEARQRVWLPGAKTIDLGRSPLLLRLLTTLADHGGRASKETLCLRVWGEAEYHKLRHDKRIQVAVRELRERIEADPSNPTRIVTTEDGYALGAAEPVRRLRPSRNLDVK